MTDAELLELSIAALTRNFDAFIGACMDADGKPTAPTMKALMQARACLPPSAAHALTKEKAK